MMPLIVHPQTTQQLQSFTARPGHALLIHGPVGTGKSALAQQLVATILNKSLAQLADYPYLMQLDAPAISAAAIENIRQLEHFLSLRVPATGEITRLVIIHDAQALSIQAQNALLKTLEEPPQATLIIMTAPSPASLLPTIASRLQAVSVVRPSQDELTTYFTADKHSASAVNQAYAISGGLPGLMYTLLNNNDHPLKPATETARTLLQQTVYERLLTVDELAKQKPHAINTLFILQQMAHARLQSTTGSQFKRWQHILESCYEASEQLSNSGQPKLVLDALMLKLN